MLGLGAASLFFGDVLHAAGREIPFARISSEQGLPQASVHCFLQDSTGFLWFGTQDGLARFDGYSFRIYKYDPVDLASLPASWVQALAEDPGGDLWVGTQGGGLARWRRANDTFDRFRHDPEDPSSLPGDSIRGLHLGGRGDLWVATFQSGLARLDRAGWTFQTFRHDPELPSSLADDRTRAVTEDRQGNLWIGTLGGLDFLSRSAIPEWDSGASAVFEHYRAGEPSGLPDSRVHAILETSTGELWVGTEGGLARHLGDGTFEVFRNRPGDSSSLPHNWITALLEDDEGRLWIATDGGLALWREGRFDTYRHDPADFLSLSGDRVLALHQDRSGVLWVGTQGGGASRWNPRTWAFSNVRARAGSGLSNDAVFAFSEDRSGRLYVGTFGGGVDVFERGDEGTNERLQPLSDVPGGLPGNRVTALYHDREDGLWVGTLRDGLGYRRQGGDRFEIFRHDPDRADSLADDDVAAILEDQVGELWIATHGGGLQRFDPESRGFSGFRNHPERPESLSDDHLNALAIGTDNSLWIGTFGGGLERLDPQRQRFHHLRHDPYEPSGLASDTVYSLHLDESGTLWVGTSAGLGRLMGEPEQEPLRFRNYFERDGLPNHSVWGIRSDGLGRLWISTNNGLARFDPRAERFKAFRVANGLPANEFNLGAHFESRTGELFFGGIKGFTGFDPEAVGLNDHVPPVVVTSFHRVDDPPRYDRGFLESDGFELGHRDYFFSLEFSALDFNAPAENRYRYKLEGFDQSWVELGPRRRVTFTNLDAGRYLLRVRGSNNDGVWNREGIALPILVRPAPWATWWAYTLYSLLTACLVAGFLYRQNLKVRRAKALAARLREVDRMRDEFLATTSHELKTPLYGISGLAEGLLQDPGIRRSKASQGHLEAIVSSGRRLSHLVDDLLDISKLRHGSLQLHRESVDLAAITDVVLTLSRPLVGDRPLELRNRVDPDLPAASADGGRLQQILLNLIGNAIKFTERGRIEVSARQVGNQLEVEVSDSGPGIEEKDQERIFLAFEQVDASTERRYSGTGLGLSIARQLVELHEGKMWVRSRAGAGSRFFFTLPMATGQDAVASVAGVEIPALFSHGLVTPETDDLEQVSGAPAPDASRLDEVWVENAEIVAAARLLIVDDEPVNRRVLVQHLVSAGLTVRQARSGSEALTLLGQETFDLVLLDVMMPRMSGYEVCRRLREAYGKNEMAVLFLTAKTQLVDRLTGFEEGANDYLVKPVAREELLARVITQLELLWLHRKLREKVDAQSGQIEELREMLPICANCKSIRDDEGFWNRIETYLEAHSNTVLTHSLCPTCAEEFLTEARLLDPSQSPAELPPETPS